MVKGKDSSAFYEVLKNSVGGVRPSEGSVKPADESVAPSVAQPAQTYKPPFVARNVGENVIRISYNTTAFLAMVIIAIIFIAFALGVRYGKSQIPSAQNTAAPVERQPVNDGGIVPPAARTDGNKATPRVDGGDRKTPVGEAPKDDKWWTIRLVEYNNGSQDERTMANHLADMIEKEVEQAGLGGKENFVRGVIGSGNNEKLVVWYGKFTDRNSREAKEVLDKLQKLKKNGKPLFPVAAFEERRKTAKN